MEKDKKPTPKPEPKPKDVPEDDAPPTGPDGKYLKPRPFKKGGSVGSASKRADGCAVRGKTRA
jgi:hypothetical protein